MDVGALRRFYAETIGGGNTPYRQRLVDAFASVPRERFLGPGPWEVAFDNRYIVTPSDDLIFLYQDQLFSLASDRRIHNGSPSSHAQWLSAAAPQAGETVVHVGAGTGYYTAVLRELVGAQGAIVAYEIAPDLAARAGRNLAEWPNVSVLCRSAIGGNLSSADFVYVNAAATSVVTEWLDALRTGGRLVMPLTPRGAFGGMLIVTRRANARFDASFLSGAMFIACEDATDDGDSARLAAAFERGDQGAVRSLRRSEPPDETCWFAATDSWLSTTPVSG